MRLMRLRLFVFDNFISNLPSCRIRAWYLRIFYKWTIGKNSRLWKGMRLDGDTYGRVAIGNNCQIGYRSYFNTHETGKIVIGSNVRFGHEVSLYGVDHDPSDPSFAMRVGDIVIEDNCWIASKASILKGVRIGKGSVVAFGSVVTHSMPENVITAGIPARILRQRYPTDA
jgi:acetyltransferase-like isoleucine patch superfamily enzyme